MSQAETLLQSLTEEVTGHTHVVTDPDSYFVINPDTREIENSSRTKNVLMQFDHNSEVYTFELARYVEGHDMTLCNRVRVHFNNIDGTTLEENADVAELYDLDICPDDENKVLCSWTITRQATQLVGTLNFLVQYECIDENGDAVYEWHTDIYTDVEIKKTINNAEQAIVEYSNVLEQWYQRIFGSGDAVLANITAEGESQVAAVAAEGNKQVSAVVAEGNKQVSAVAAKGDEYVAVISNEGATQKEAIALKGEETLATIPEDYTATYNMAEEALRRKANAIELEASGEIITIEDASDAHLLGLNVYGKSTQFNTTGRQMIPSPYFNTSETINGVTFKVNGDGSVSATGVSTAGINFYFAKNFTLPIGTYTLSYSGNFSGARLNMYDFTTLESIAVVQDGTTTVTFTTSKEYNNVSIYLNTATVEKEFSGTIYPMLEVGNVRSNYEPYTGGIASPNPDYPQDIESVENPTVSIYGKNLLDIPESYTINKATLINVNLPAGDYVLSFDSESHDGAENPEFRFYDNKIWKTLTEASKSQVVRISKPETKIYLYSNGTSSNASEGVSATVNKLMVSKIDGDYEPYKPVQTLTIDRTLSGIPVTSGGNYTDSTGQQWTCDEIDLERGVYIQRIKRTTLVGESSEGWTEYNNNASQGLSFVYWASDGVRAFNTSLCDKYTNVSGCWGAPYLGRTGIYSDHDTGSGRYFRPPNDSVTTMDEWLTWLAENPVSIQYILETPIETSLTDEEIAYYKKLKTNYHDTVVFNDCNAHMAIKYAADTLIYMRDHQPKPTDEQVENSVNLYLDQNGVQVPSDDHIRGLIDEVLGGIVNDEY